MEKIVILAGNSEADSCLVTCLNLLFPDCEIQVLSRRPESFKEDDNTRERNTSMKVRKGSKANTH